MEIYQKWKNVEIGDWRRDWRNFVVIGGCSYKAGRKASGVFSSSCPPSLTARLSKHTENSPISFLLNHWVPLTVSLPNKAKNKMNLIYSIQYSTQHTEKSKSSCLSHTHTHTHTLSLSLEIKVVQQPRWEALTLLSHVFWPWAQFHFQFKLYLINRIE